MFVLRVVNRDGTCDRREYRRRHAVNKHWQHDLLRLRAGEILGIGLDEVTDTGEIRAIQASYSNIEEETEQFLHQISLSREKDRPS